MRRRLLGTLVWCVLVPIVGTVQLLLMVLRLFLSLSPKTQLMLLGLAFALTLPNPITAQIRTVELTPQDEMRLAGGTAAVGFLGVVAIGVRSRALRRLKRWVEQLSLRRSEPGWRGERRSDAAAGGSTSIRGS